MASKKQKKPTQDYNLPEHVALKNKKTNQDYNLPEHVVPKNKKTIQDYNLPEHVAPKTKKLPKIIIYRNIDRKKQKNLLKTKK